LLGCANPLLIRNFRHNILDILANAEPLHARGRAHTPTREKQCHFARMSRMWVCNRPYTN